MRLHLLEERLSKRMDADLLLLVGLIEHICIAGTFLVNELKPVRFSVTPDEVSEEEFLDEWEKRLEKMKETGRAELQKRYAKRNQRIAASLNGDGKGDAGGGE